VVTDIPSFRMMTGGGAIGALWPPGDAPALAATLRRVLARPRAEQATTVRQYFEQRLSFAAIGRRARAVYRDLAARRTSPSAGS
jgi:glycosyltransferase involved in cell wall biosynthesis